MTSSSAATVVLVHGAWHGGWCWGKVVRLLDASGVPSQALDLGGPDGYPGDLAADVAAVQAALDAAGGPAVLCGHSYGGLVVTEAGVHPAVAHLAYIAAFVPDAGETMSDGVGGAPRRGLDAAVGDDGLLRLGSQGAALLYHDCDPADASAASAQLRPQRLEGFRRPVAAAAWRSRPATYAICAEDRAVEPQIQRAMAERAGAAIVEWPTGHSPFLSRPDLVAGLLAGLARRSADPAGRARRPPI